MSICTEMSFLRASDLAHMCTGNDPLKNILFVPSARDDDLYSDPMHGNSSVKQGSNSPRILSCMYWFCAGGYPVAFTFVIADYHRV